MSAHAKFSPSKLSRILACPASAQVEESLSSSTYAEEGTLLHNVVEQGLKTYLLGQSWAAKIRSFNLNVEQVNAVEECMLYAINKISSMRNPQVLLEQRFYIAKDCDGTADLTLFDGEELHVIDWKFGQGVEVSAQENTQLMAYGYGAIQEFNLGGNYHIPVSLHVIQPRLNNFDTYCTSVNDLNRWVEYVLLPGLTVASHENAPFNPSMEACRWCPRKQSCSARLQLAMTNAEDVFKEHAKLPDIPLTAIEKLLPMAEQIEAVIKDLKLYATQQLSDGKEVPGFKLVRGRSNRAWADPEAAGEFLASHLEPEDMYEMKMVSPAEAEKLIDRDTRKSDDFLSLVHKPEGKVTLAPESDKRQAISLDGESVFAQCVQNN